MTKSRQTQPDPGPHGADASSLSRREIHPRTLIFVSHDNRDANLAEAFSNMLLDVSAGTLKSFRASDKKGQKGIDFGAEWYSTIMSYLDQATDVVAIITENSLERPWILYEAGVAKGKLNTTVFGVAFGIPLERVNTGPFGQFQNCDSDEDSLTKLIWQLLRRNPDAEPRERAIRRELRAFLSDLPALLPNIRPSPVASSQDTQKTSVLFEETKAMIREIMLELTHLRQHSTLSEVDRGMWDELSVLWPSFNEALTHFTTGLRLDVMTGRRRDEFQELSDSVVALRKPMEALMARLRKRVGSVSSQASANDESR